MKNAFRFGSGRDGNVTVSGATISLTRDMHYKNLVIDATGTIDANGYRIYVSEVLVLDGVIQRNGLSAVGATGGGSLAARTLGLGARGANGALGNGANGTASTLVQGAAGGRGGNGATSTGGNPGLAAPPSAATGGREAWNSGPQAWNPAILASGSRYNGGSGGGAGGGNSIQNGGGSGGGGAIVHVYAAKIVGSGSISAVGGNGGDGEGFGCGGGGGGGGGCVVVCSSTLESQTNITINVSGGIGGAGGGGLGVDGSNGQNGRYYWIDEDSWVYGNGVDGDVVISFTTLTRDMYYNNLTFDPGGTLNTNGFRIFVKNKIDFGGSGIIRRNGNTATSTLGATGLTGNSTALSSSGGNGGVVNGLTGTSNTNSLGVNGGKGGNGSSGNGGNGGTSTAPLNSNGGLNFPRSLPTAQNSWLIGNSSLKYNGSAGGGGGAGNGADAGGGGGSGAGSILLFARYFAPNAGTIEAVGGQGAQGLNPDCGGGGGGGGGIIICVTAEQLNTLPVTFNVSGGSGGFGYGGSGLDGDNGSDGRLYLLRSA